MRGTEKKYVETSSCNSFARACEARKNFAVKNSVDNRRLNNSNVFRGFDVDSSYVYVLL